MKRRLLFSILMTLGASPPTLSAASTPQPNIMVFLVDDMGVMDTSVPFLTNEAGQAKRYPLNDYYLTPAMERLASRGIRFNRFYAMNVCSPTRISLLTGRNAARHRTTNWINPRKDNAGPKGAPGWNWQGLKAVDVTLPGLLRMKGYRTIHVGKGHFGPEGSEGSEPLNLGFDINVGGDSWGAPGSYYGVKNYGRGDDRIVPHLEKYHGSETYLTEALTMEAKRHVVETLEDDEPFFLYLSHYAVHAPFDSDPRFAGNYRDSGKSDRAQAFATLIEGMDKSLGDMLDQFDESGVAKDTLVIFLGDNGSDAPLGHQHDVACAAPLRGKKGAHYEGGMRVPFIAAWAERDPENRFQRRLPIPAGRIQGQVANVTDLFPTLLALTDSAAPPDHVIDGLGLHTLLGGEPDPKRPERFLMHYPHGPHRSNYFTTWRDGDWKVIYHNFPDEPPLGGRIQSGGERYELFNLEEDPFESTNLATSRPVELRRMMAGLTVALEDHHAVYPVDENGVILTPRMP